MGGVASAQVMAEAETGTETPEVKMVVEVYGTGGLETLDVPAGSVTKICGEDCGGDCRTVCAVVTLYQEPVRGNIVGYVEMKKTGQAYWIEEHPDGSGGKVWKFVLKE